MAANRTPLPNLQPILLGIGFALLVAISAGTVYLVDRASTDAHWLSHTLVVQGKLSNLLLNVRRAESGQRGYLFTGQRVYLDDVTASEPIVTKLIAELHDITSDNPARQRDIDAIAALSAAKFAEMKRVLAVKEAGPPDAAQREVFTGTGRALMNDLRDKVDATIADESRLLAGRTADSENTDRQLLLLTLVGSVLIVLIGAASVVLVQRSARQREAARKELESTNANLERIVEYRTADLTEANEEIQRFAYIVSHDLRSPLVNIMGFTSELEALRKDIFDQVARLSAELAALNAQAAEAANDGEIERLGADFDEAIRFIKTSIANMDRLINAVLKLSREGRREFRPERVDMDEVMGSIAATVTHRAVELGARIEVGPLPSIETDRLAVEQIFANLVDNALKYGREGAPLHIEITGRMNGAQAVYDVRDNGRGIDPGDHARVFELFRRSGPQDRPGEGIGLAHVKALVRRLGGTMGLSSRLGEGSTFTVTLPRRWTAGNRSRA